jgi:hypothetical protein
MNKLMAKKDTLLIAEGQHTIKGPAGKPETDQPGDWPFPFCVEDSARFPSQPENLG